LQSRQEVKEINLKVIIEQRQNYLDSIYSSSVLLKECVVSMDYQSFASGLSALWVNHCAFRNASTLNIKDDCITVSL